MNFSPSSALAATPLETSLKTSSDTSTGGTDSTGGEAYLLFRLQGALMAVEAAQVGEIFALPELSPLAQAPPFVIGVLNLRGSFVPVLDLACRLGQVPTPLSTSDILIVLEWPGTRVGIRVSEVLHVTSISSVQQEALPQVARAVSQSPFVRALARLDEGTVMLLHAENLLRTDIESPPVEEAAHSTRGPFAPHASEEERAIFVERARRLKRAESEADSADLVVPLALVSLGGEPFGIGLESVREFCRVGAVTPVPCCPPHIVGQMNLRGDILSLLDIRALLRLPPAVQAESPRVVVAQSGGVTVGVLVDEVLDVIYLSASDLRAAPGTLGEGKYFAGGMRHGERILGVLDLSRVLGEESLVVDESV